MFLVSPHSHGQSVPCSQQLLGSHTGGRDAKEVEVPMDGSWLRHPGSLAEAAGRTFGSTRSMHSQCSKGSLAAVDGGLEGLPELRWL